MNNNWTDMTFSKKGPTDAELLEIEHDLTSIDLNEGFEENKVESITEKELEERMKVFNKKELKMIDEMIRIMEEPEYISPARKRRLEAMDDHDIDDEDEVESVSFGEDMMLGGIYDVDE